MQITIGNKVYDIHNFHKFIFVVGAFKLVLLAFFSSDYQNLMFMPFVQSFLDGSAGLNPYEYYQQQELLQAFPYPPLMLLILSPCMGLILLLQRFGLDSLYLQNLMFKLPIFIFDCLGLYFLLKICPHNRKYVGLFYFASPIVIYSSYMHGQLDIIPTTLFMGSLYFLLDKKPEQSSIKFVLMLAFSLLTKLHILAVLPIIFIYIINKQGYKQLLKQAAMLVLIFSVFVFPFWGEGFIYRVLFNSEQAVLTQITFSFSQVQILIPVLALLFVYFTFYQIKSVNKDLLLSFCTVLFAVFLIFVPPMPGWYVWIVPFVTIFFIQIDHNKYKNTVIFFGLNAVYLLYFICCKDTRYVDLYYLNHSLDLLKLHHSAVQNFVFTILEGFLIYSTLIIYRLGIASNAFFRKNTPFIIGIAGDSGSGKSEFLHLLNSALGTKNILQIEGDGDHRWERGEEMWNHYTHLNPKANFLYRQARDINTLRKGSSVTRVDYDHHTGKFSESKIIKPNRFIVVCGLHSLYLPQTRHALDLRVFMDTQPELQRYWKIRRDIAIRGYSPEKILMQIAARDEDVTKYIYPQREYANFIVEYFDPSIPKEYDEDYEVNLSLRVTLSASLDLEPFIYEVSRFHVDVQYDYTQDLTKQVIVFPQIELNKTVIPYSKIANRLIPRLDEITLCSLDDSNNLHGILKLLLVIFICHRLQSYTRNDLEQIGDAL